jgi:hypothetical protein
MLWTPAVCGVATDNIFIRDLGNGSCAATSIINGVVRQNTCNAPIFSTPCGSFAGILQIFVANELALNVTTYVQPNINLWLTNLGLSQITILGSLRFLVDQTPVAVPSFVAPVFLETLRQVGSIFIAECLKCDTAPNVGPLGRSVLTALPGLKNVYQLAPGPNNLLVVQNTAFKNLTSFSSLTCPPPVILLTNNTNLTNFFGFENLATPTGDGTILNAAGSGPFTDISSIKVLGNCYNTPISDGTFVAIPTTCRVLSSYPAACAFANGVAPCPPR